MKTMNRMQMQGCCCCCMMAMTRRESVYIIGINKIKNKGHEKNRIGNSSIIEYQYQSYLG